MADWTNLLESLCGLVAFVLLPIIDSLKADGLGLRAIARELSRRGIATTRGGTRPAPPSKRFLARPMTERCWICPLEGDI